jgi:glucose-1-phosphate cytidylyltransferase
MERAHSTRYRPAVPGGPAPPVVLLCGGAGDYIAEAGKAVPRPLLSIAGRPLLVHIMRQLAGYGSTEFVLGLTGPVQQQVKDYLLRLELRSVNFTIRLGIDPTVRILDELPEEGWTITCADTGELPGTGTRLRNAASFVPRWPIIVGYGRGLADVNVADLVRFHRAHGRMATVAVAAPPARPGRVTLADDHRVLGIGGHTETPSSLASIGLFVLEEAAVEGYIKADADVMLDAEPVRDLIADGELMAYRHRGYWQPLDTWEDVAAARRAWQAGPARPGFPRQAEPRDGGRAAKGTRSYGVGRLSALTSRELQVATLVGNCLTNRAIARRLSVAEKTVEMHLSRIFGKLALSSRTELAALMIRTQQLTQEGALHQPLEDRQPVHVRGAFHELEGADIPADLLQPGVLDERGRAEELGGEERRVFRCVRRLHLGRAYLVDVDLAAMQVGGDPVDQPARGGDAVQHVLEPQLVCPAQRRPVQQDIVTARLGAAERHRADSRAETVQDPGRAVQATPAGQQVRTEQVLPGDMDVIKAQPADPGAAQAHHGQRLRAESR